jgi:hypothetical protein
MDPITGMLILVGLFYASRGAIRAAGHASAVSSGGSSSPGGRSRSSGTYKGPSWAGGRGHTGLSWWASEIGHGFPVTAGGFRQGWRAHQTAMLEHRERGASQTATYAEARREHIRRMTEAQRRASIASGGTIDTRPPKVKAHRPSRKGKAKRAAKRILVAGPPKSKPQPPDTICPWCTPLPDGTHEDICPRSGKQSAGKQPASKQPRDKHMGAPGETCTNPNCECRDSQPADHNGQPPTGGNQPVSTPNSSSGDATYTSTRALIEQIIRDAEHAVDDRLVTDAQTHADALPTMLPDDPDTVSHISEAAAALAAAKAKAEEAAEAAAAAKQSHEQHNAASKEAADSQGGAPERDYVVND